MAEAKITDWRLCIRDPEEGCLVETGQVYPTDGAVGGLRKWSVVRTVVLDGESKAWSTE
jgi:hypothetical protein